MEIFSVFGLFLIPLVFSVVVFMLAKVSEDKLQKVAFAFSLAPLILLLWGGSDWLGSESRFDWLKELSIRFDLKIDSLSYLFVALTVIVIPIAILANRSEERFAPNVFYGLILLAECALIGFFTARDLFLFTLFFEAMLLPLFFLIAIWGGNLRRNASLMFLIYMAAGSFLMVAGLVGLFTLHHTFDMGELAVLQSPYWIGAVFFLAFAVKTPLFPFHAWLPTVYVEANTAGTILLSALLSKAGIYGFARLGTELFPTLLKDLSPILLCLAVAGVFYGGFAAWGEKNYKRLIAYSSLSHVNFILAGLFILNPTAYLGSILQAFNHGITITALFLVAGWLEMRVKTRQIDQVRGLAHMLPHLAWLTLFFVLSSIALPLTNTFVGEFLILFGSFGKNPWIAVLLTLSLVLGAIYMLRFMQKIYFESPDSAAPQLSDIKGKEFLTALPLILLILWVGIYPRPFIEKIEGTKNTSERTNEQMNKVKK